jgi:hypothetical protein
MAEFMAYIFLLHKIDHILDNKNINSHIYCDMHAVGQQSTVETLFITISKQRNNGSDQRFLCGPFR